MATSSFRSTTKRTSMGKSSTGGDNDSGSSDRSSGHRRYRSLSRFSHRTPDLDAEVTPVRKGRFVNTVRGSGFPEISLDDLAVEFFDSVSTSSEDRERSSSRKSDASRSGSAGKELTASERRGRSVSRVTGGNISGGGRVFSETESSWRRRSVSRGGVGSGGGSGRLDAETESSRRRRSVSRQPSRGSVGNTVGTVKAVSGRGNSKKRRSVSVVRCRISDSESDVDHSQSSSVRGNLKSSAIGNSQISGSRKPVASDSRPGLRRSFSQNELQCNDGYSSQSSAVTDDEGRNSSSGVERIRQAVHSQKKGEHLTGNDVNVGFYKAMRKEFRHALDEIRAELVQTATRTRNSIGDGDYGSGFKASNALHSVSTMMTDYAAKLQESEQQKRDLLDEILLEQQCGRELSKTVKELRTDPNDSGESGKPLQSRKRSKDRNRMSKCLTEEAEKYIEDFIANIEDTDISSLDGERSETSSNFGRINVETFQTPPLQKSVPEMDGVMLPWLQWETPSDASPLPCKNMLQHTPTSKSKFSDSNRDASTGHNASIRSISSRGSWSPCDSGTKSIDPRFCQTQISPSGPIKLKIDMGDYLNRKSDQDFAVESWKHRNQINSGRMLLCCNRMFF